MKRKRVRMEKRERERERMGAMGGNRAEKKVEVKRAREGWVGVWWGYDELKMTLSGSLVSKDHSVC